MTPSPDVAFRVLDRRILRAEVPKKLHQRGLICHGNKRTGGSFAVFLQGLDCPTFVVGKDGQNAHKERVKQWA